MKNSVLQGRVATANFENSTGDRALPQKYRGCTHQKKKNIYLLEEICIVIIQMNDYW